MNMQNILIFVENEGRFLTSFYLHQTEVREARMREENQRRLLLEEAKKEELLRKAEAKKKALGIWSKSTRLEPLFYC